MLLVDCSACQVGDHARHIKVVKAAPKDMMGGSSCPCTGDCAERNKDRPNSIMDALVDAIQGSFDSPDPKPTGTEGRKAHKQDQTFGGRGATDG